VQVNAARGFWNTLKEVSPKGIEKEAAEPFRFAIVGDDAARARLRGILLTGEAVSAEHEAAAGYLTELEQPPDATAAGSYTFVFYGSGAPEQLSARGANSVPLIGTPAQVAAGVIAQRPDLAVAIGRRFPLFRNAASQRVITDASRVNASFALVSALPGVIPITAIFLPASAIADTLVLTKNQIMMVMRLATIHGHQPGYTRQIKELIGTVGSALGWRTLARQLVSLVPAGVGAAFKAAIAVSGTYALGRAALLYYQTGRKPTPKQIREAYTDRMKDARQDVEALRREQTRS